MSIHVAEEKFVETMEELINDEELRYLEVIYYHSGGCSVEVMKDTPGGALDEKYYFEKPANKIARVSGELGYIAGQNPSVVFKVESYSNKQVFTITRQENTKPEEEVAVTPEWVKSSEVNGGFAHSLEIIEHALRDPKVTSVTIDTQGPILLVRRDDANGNKPQFSFSIPLKESDLNDTLAFINLNADFLAKKYFAIIASNFAGIRIKRLDGIAALARDTAECTFAIIENNGLGFINKQFETGLVSSVRAYSGDRQTGPYLDVHLNEGAIVNFKVAKEVYSELLTVMEDDLSPELKVSVDSGKTAKDSCINFSKRPSYGKNEQGKDVVDNVLSFVRESLTNPNIYRIAVTKYDEGNVNIEGTNGHRKNLDANMKQIEYAISKLQPEADEISKKHNVIFEVNLHESGSRISFRRNIRVGVEPFIKNGTINELMVEFLQDAYRAGVNIVIGGNTGSGKTTFLRMLSESVNDAKITALIDTNSELLFAEGRDDFIALRGSYLTALKSAVKFQPARIIVDEVPHYGKELEAFEEAANSDIQLVGTMHSISVERASDYSRASNFSTKWPFEIGVNLKWEKVGENKYVHYVSEIIQFTVSEGGSVTSRVLWKVEDNNFILVEEPSRNLRRKIEASKVKAKSGLIERIAEKISSDSNSALVTFSKEELEEIKQSLDILQNMVSKF